MTTPITRPDAVTFDFWNTLISESRSADHRTQRWVDLLADHGHRVDGEQLDKALQRMWEWFVQRWEGNVVVAPDHAVDVVLETLDIARTAELHAGMAESLREGFDPADMATAPGIGDALEALRSAGVRIGIICDVGLTPSSTLRRYLDHHGLLGHFDHWSFSDDVGVYKPHERIFTHAAEGLGLGSGAAFAHVGDLRRTDVAGARAMGWTSVRYTGLSDDASDLPEADHVVAHHAEAVAVLLGR